MARRQQRRCRTGRRILRSSSASSQRRAARSGCRWRTSTQQPFPIHLLSLITDLALAVNAVHVGTSAGRTLAMEAHTPLNTVLMVMVQLLRVAAFTLIYQGLLGIGIALDNPCGDARPTCPGSRSRCL